VTHYLKEKGEKKKGGKGSSLLADTYTGNRNSSPQGPWEGKGNTRAAEEVVALTSSGEREGREERLLYTQGKRRRSLLNSYQGKERSG